MWTKVQKLNNFITHYSKFKCLEKKHGLEMLAYMIIRIHI